MSGFFEEVRRRKVYRVAAAYVIAAGFIIQISSAVFPAWELPNWAFRLVVVFLLIGFPISLILAWAYDLTPQGIRATPAPQTHRRRNLIMLIAIGVVVSAVAGFFLFPRASGRNIEKSIAVLPFQSLSDEKENAYFADGIQDDILTNLAKIGDLKVISRMSVMPYRGDAVRNAREIGKALGVATLLEGSVRRIGNRVRVSVQLINANSDEHIWAEDYDRDLTDVFAIQTDLAQKIASALQAKLSPNEKARLDQQANPKFRRLSALCPGTRLRQSQGNVPRQVLERPSSFSNKRLSSIQTLPWLLPVSRIVESWIYHSFDPTPGRREKARRNADEALRLQPDLPEGHLALGFSYYYGDRDYERALAEFDIAKRGLPNESEAYFAIGAIQRRQGKWAESTANLEKAATLDPKNAEVLINLCFSYMAQRDFETADKILDRMIAASPQSFETRVLKGFVAAQWKGDLSVAEKVFSSIPPETDPDGLITMGRVWLLLLQRKLPEALQVVQQFRGETLFNTTTARLTRRLSWKARFTGFRAMKRKLEQLSNTPALFRSSCYARPLMIQLDTGSTASSLRRWVRSRKPSPKASAQLNCYPNPRTPLMGRKATAALAEIYARTGEFDEAFRLLDHLLAIPTHGLTVPMLKLDPAWDPLRKDPRYQTLIDKYSAKS